MTDITDDQRADVRDLSAYARANSDTVLGTRLARVLALLPSNLTDPQPVLPTEPGVYRDRNKDIWRHLAGGGWMRLVDRMKSDPERFAPFIRLVPERVPFTREQIEATLRASGVSYESQADAILALVNGPDRD